MDTLPTKALPIQPLPMDTLPAKALLIKPLSTKALPNKTLPIKPLPTKALPNITLPTEALPLKPLPTDTIPTKALPNKTIPTEALPMKTVPMVSLEMLTLPNITEIENLTVKDEKELVIGKEPNIISNQTFSKDLNCQPKSNLSTTGEDRDVIPRDNRQRDISAKRRQNTSKKNDEPIIFHSTWLRNNNRGSTKAINKESNQEKARAKTINSKSKFIKKSNLKEGKTGILSTSSKNALSTTLYVDFRVYIIITIVNPLYSPLLGTGLL